MPKHSVISVACYDVTMLISVQGLGSMNNSNAMYNFINEGLKKGFKDAFIDLSQCEGLDSTFMGTLLLLHEEITENKGVLSLINVSEYNRSKLDELGVGQFLKMGVEIDIPELSFEPLPNENNNNQRMNLVLRAHEELVNKNSENSDKFGVFISSLKASFK